MSAASDRLTGWDEDELDTLITDFKESLLGAEDARNYRNGYMGLRLRLEAGTFDGVTYDRGLLDWIRVIDDERMSISGQEIQAFDTTGQEEFQPAWAFACQAASI